MMLVLQAKGYEKEAQYNMFSIDYGLDKIYPSFTQSHKANLDFDINMIDNC